MLIVILQTSLVLMMFVLVFISVRHLGIFLWRRRTARSRLSRREWGWKQASRFHWWVKLSGHLRDMLEMNRFLQSVPLFLTISTWLGLAGIASGIVVFRSFEGALVLTVILGLFPYLILRLRLISRQLKTRLDFLPAVEVFYQQYRLSPVPNIRVVLQEIVTGERLQYPVKSAFLHLHRSLSAGREPDDALRIFELEMGHVWAEYFTSMLRIAMKEGVGVGDQLKDLISDMRRAQLYDQKARNRLLEIRIASFSPVVFLLLFLGVNFKLNYANSYRFYFLQEAGRTMLLHAVVLIFISFIIGIYLSMRRM